MNTITPSSPILQPSIETTRPSAMPVLDAIGIAGLAATVAIHTTELSGKIEETQYLGFGYLLLVAASIVAIVMIAQRDVRGWLLGGMASAATLVGFVLTRTTGLPGATGDIGNWSEPIAVWSLFAEGIVVLVALKVVAGRRPSPSRR